jgi:Ser/Thr protein kinase RdoA (MazF antagonist)
MVRLINHSENQTFAVQAPSGARYCLRVHRPGYQSRASIESELAWLAALRRNTDLPIPSLAPGLDGRALQYFRTLAGEGRSAVLFNYADGTAPNLDQDQTNLFRTLGVYAATLHTHATTWPRPLNFWRPEWTAETILRSNGLWGDWRKAPGVDGRICQLLEQTGEALGRSLALYGKAPDRFGLIHADMRLGNLLVDGTRTMLIDFDDCGFGWFTYDFAAAISFHETHPAVPELRAAWLQGYASIRTLHPDDIASLDTMILLRRTALLAWIGSHGETALARQHADGFAAETAELAKRYLR